MKCARAGTSSACCETRNSSVLGGTCSRWIKNKVYFRHQIFQPWNFFHRQSRVTGLCVLDRTRWKKYRRCETKIKLAHFWRPGSAARLISLLTRAGEESWGRSSSRDTPIHLLMSNERLTGLEAAPQLNERYSGHFHNNVKRWWKEIDEEQHLGPLWSLMTLRGRGAKKGKSQNILCVTACVLSRTEMTQEGCKPSAAENVA